MFPGNEQAHKRGVGHAPSWNTCLSTHSIVQVSCHCIAWQRSSVRKDQEKFTLMERTSSNGTGFRRAIAIALFASCVVRNLQVSVGTEAVSAWLLPRTSTGSTIPASVSWCACGRLLMYISQLRWRRERMCGLHLLPRV